MNSSIHIRSCPASSSSALALRAGYVSPQPAKFSERTSRANNMEARRSQERRCCLQKCQPAMVATAVPMIYQRDRNNAPIRKAIAVIEQESRTRTQQRPSHRCPALPNDFQDRDVPALGYLGGERPDSDAARHRLNNAVALSYQFDREERFIGHRSPPSPYALLFLVGDDA